MGFKIHSYELWHNQRYVLATRNIHSVQWTNWTVQQFCKYTPTNFGNDIFHFLAGEYLDNLWRESGHILEMIVVNLSNISPDISCFASKISPHLTHLQKFFFGAMIFWWVSNVTDQLLFCVDTHRSGVKHRENLLIFSFISLPQQWRCWVFFCSDEDWFWTRFWRVSYV